MRAAAIASITFAGICTVLIFSSTASTGTDDQLSEFIERKVAMSHYAAVDEIIELGDDAVPYLIVMLGSHEDPNYRSAAAKNLGGIGKDAAESIPNLINALKDDVLFVRDSAVDALVSIGPELTLHRLINELDKDDPATLAGVVIVLWKMGPGAVDAAPMLIELLDQPYAYCDQEPSTLAFAALQEMDDGVVPYVLKGFTHVSPVVRKNICDLVPLLNVDGNPLLSVSLIGAVDDPEWEVRKAAIESLAKVAEENVVSPILIKSLNDDSGEIRSSAFYLLTKYEPTPEIVEAILDMSDNPDVQARVRVVRWLSELMPWRHRLNSEDFLTSRYNPSGIADVLRGALGNAQANRAADFIIRSLSDEDRALSLLVLSAFEKSKVREPSVIPQLINILEHEQDEKIIKSAIAALGYNGPESPEVVSLLTRLLDEGKFRDTVIEAIGYLGPIARNLTPQFISMLDSTTDSTLSGTLIFALGKIGPAEIVVPKLTSYLDDEIFGFYAARGLCYLGEAGLPPLKEALSKGSETARYNSIYALQEMGAMARGALPELINALDDPHDYNRRSASEALINIGTDVEGVFPALAKVLNDDVILPRSGAIEAIGKMGPKAIEATDGLLRCLASDYDGRRAAAVALHSVTPDAFDTVLYLMTELETFPGGVRLSAAEQGLSEIGADAFIAIPRLTDIAENGLWYGAPKSNAEKTIAAIKADMEEKGITGLADPYAWMRDADFEQLRSSYINGGRDEKTRAAFEMSLRGKDAKAASTVLLSGIYDEDMWVRWISIHALGAVGPSPEAVDALTRLLNNGPALIRQEDAVALRNFGPVAETAVPELVLMLQDSNVDMRVAAIKALERIGPGASFAIPTLLELLKTDNDHVQSGAFPSFLELLETDNDYVQSRTALALGQMGKHPEVSIALANALEKSLKDPYSSYGYSYKPLLPSAIMRAVETLGSDAVDAVPVLLRITKDENEYVSSMAVRLLGEIGPVAAEIEGVLDAVKNDPLVLAKVQGLESIVELLDDESIMNREEVVKAIGKYGSEAEVYIPMLIGLLDDEYGAVRQAAAEALGDIGPAASEALPKLDLLSMSDEYREYPMSYYSVRFAAQQTIEKIQGTWVEPDFDIVWVAPY